MEHSSKGYHNYTFFFHKAKLYDVEPVYLKDGAEKHRIKH